MNGGMFFFIAIAKKVIVVDSRNIRRFVFRFSLLVKNKIENQMKKSMYSKMCSPYKYLSILFN